MAVQAQYSSNALLLNRGRGIQEGKNQLGNGYTMQQGQQGGGGAFLDQTHFIFHNNTPPVNDNHTNQRKRGREINSIFSSSSMHQQQQSHFQEPQLTDLTQLRNPPQNTIVSTGLGLSFGDHLQNQSLSLLTQDFAVQMKHHRDEIDQFLQAQARARAQEATATSLQTQLRNAIMRQGGAQNHEGTLTCASGEVAADDAESAYIDPERVEVSRGPSCKACQKRVASVVVLPCRHLSVCTECDGVVQSCPLCLSFRSSSVEVFLG